jgi:hypothetical protein
VAQQIEAELLPRMVGSVTSDWWPEESRQQTAGALKEHSRGRAPTPPATSSPNNQFVIVGGDNSAGQVPIALAATGHQVTKVIRGPKGSLLAL